MAMDQSALLELLEMLKAADVDERIRVAAQNVYQALIDAEAAEKIGAGRWERTDARMAVRNGSRARVDCVKDSGQSLGLIPSCDQAAVAALR